MSYQLRLEVETVQCAIRALDLLRRLDVAMLDMETTRQDGSFLVDLTYDASSESAARHIAVRIGQIVGVISSEMASPRMPDARLLHPGAPDKGSTVASLAQSQRR